jgi:hypothetical protein
MSRFLPRTAIALSATLLLAACASGGSGASYTAQKRLQPASYEVDAERVALIEHIARKRGVEVHWVNKPQRIAASTD